MIFAAPLYDRIGRGYDDTRRADLRVAKPLMDLLGPPDAGPVLDVGCGTGNYTAVLAAHGYDMTGLELSSEMLDRARAKLPDATFHQGSVMDLPFADGQFGRAVCTLAAHHFPDKEAAFREVRRVLTTGPFVLFATFAEQTRRYWLARYFPRMIERSAAKLGAEAEWRAALHGARFGHLEVRAWQTPADVTDLFLYSGKFRPELYFDANVRKGISSFAALADEAEVAAGLARLRADIDSGVIGDVIAASVHAQGDYAHIAAWPGSPE